MPVTEFAVRFRGWLLAAAIVAIALVPRIGYVLANPGGYSGTFAYDPSVYYGSAAAMLHGRWPYADFVLLHPPLASLVLLPFAALGAVTRDSVGFESAQVAFAIVGSINAGLVFAVARRVGVGTVGAALGGLFYAVWPGASLAEFSSRLEPLGNFAVLLALLALARAERTAGRVPATLCGVALGLACCIKIWWLGPLIVALAWHLAPGRRDRFGWVAAGAGVSIVVVNLPFFVAAPRAMARMVTTAQLDRPSGPLSMIDRLSAISGLGGIDLRPVLAVAIAATCGFAAVLAALAYWSRGNPFASLTLTCTVLTIALLIAAPSYFPFYADFVAPFLALLVALATRRLAISAGPARSTAPALVAAAIVAGLVAVDVAASRRVVLAYPAAALRPAVAGARCVVSDSPMALIELDVLDRDLARGCPNWIDVSGQAFHLGLAHRQGDPAWQRRLTRYLLSGDAVTLLRATDTGIGPDLRRIIRGLPRRAVRGHFAVYDSSMPLPPRTRRLIGRLMAPP